MGLSQAEQLVVDAIAADADRARELLETLVRINSGSRNTEGIETVAEVCAAELVSLGFALERVPGGIIDTISCPNNPAPSIQTASHLVARRTGTRGRRLLLSAHLDTVFEPSSGFLDVAQVGDRLNGPGVVDCKGGVAMLITALRALHFAGTLDDTTITVVLNSDEELGSLTSRPILEAEADRHDTAIVFEGALDTGRGTTITTARKGLGQFRVVVDGRAAHAGVSHAQGANALEELAAHVLAIQALTDYDTGTTLNVGNVVCPGCKRNIVPGCVEAMVDLRYVHTESGEEIREFFTELGAKPRVRAHADGTPVRTRTAGVLHRPPWVQTPPAAALHDLVMRVGDDLGLRLVARQSGGGSDANLIGARGCPVIDGIGPVGGAFHTREEWLHLPSLTERGQLAAIVMMRLLEQAAMEPGITPVGANYSP